MTSSWPPESRSLGLIPRLPRARGRIPLIMGWQQLENGRSGNPAGRPGQSPTRQNYAFVGTPRSLEGPTVLGNGDHNGLSSTVELASSQWTNVVSEAYSLLLTNVTFARSTPPKTVVITSPLAEDGKTTCAVNLAITLALRGGRALLIDADLRRGVVHRALGVERAPGSLGGSLGASAICRGCSEDRGRPAGLHRCTS